MPYTNAFVFLLSVSQTEYKIQEDKDVICLVHG